MTVGTVNLSYEIREVPDQGGGLRLGLIIEGKQVASAGASSDVLDSMAKQLNLTRDEVSHKLQQALSDVLKHQQDKVFLTDLIEDEHCPLLFRAGYIYRTDNKLEAGLVWYDVSTSVTGPEELPAIVRSKMRLWVHRKLTVKGSIARSLIDLV